MMENLNLFAWFFLTTVLLSVLWTKAQEYKLQKKVLVKVRAKRKKRKLR